MLKKIKHYINSTEENLKVALESDEQFKNACEDFIYGIENGENCGISFYACGYNGKAQQEFQKRMLLDYGLEVF